MSRFKFRMWVPIRGKMVYDLPQDWKLEDLHKSLGDRIMQSTGLTDENGQEIFEGDILDIYTDDDLVGRGCVFWHEDKAQFIHTYQDVVDGELIDQYNLPKTMWCEESYFSHVVVVGNKYENPELLEEA